MPKQSKPRAGSKAEKVLKLREKYPNWSVPEIAETVPCAEPYAYGVLRRYDDADSEKGTADEPRPIKPAKKKPKKRKAKKKEKAAAATAEAETADTEKFFDEKGEHTGGNGRTDYTLSGVRRHSGKVEGLDGVEMSVVLVNGDSAADVREFQAYLSSIQEVLSGLETLKSEELSDPKFLLSNALQVQNILNAAKRIANKASEVASKRMEAFRKREGNTTTYQTRAEWRAETHEVEQEEKEKVKS